MALVCISMAITMQAQPKNNKEACPAQPEAGAMCQQQCPQNRQPQCQQGQQGRQCCQQQMRPMKRGGMRQGMNDMVVNMRIIRSLGIDSTQINAIKELKRQKAEEMRAIRQSMRGNKPVTVTTPEAKDSKAEAKGKKADKKKIKKGEKPTASKPEAATPDEKKARREQVMVKMKENREKMQAVTKSYRAELRKILGDEKYIEYLEKLSQQPRQAQPMRQPQARRHNGRHA